MFFKVTPDLYTKRLYNEVSPDAVNDSVQGIPLLHRVLDIEETRLYVSLDFLHRFYACCSSKAPLSRDVGK